MSAIDFEGDIERVADPKGDRVKVGSVSSGFNSNLLDLNADFHSPFFLRLRSTESSYLTVVGSLVKDG